VVNNTRGAIAKEVPTYRQYRNRWGRLKQIQVPNAIIQGGTLALNPYSLAVLLVLLHLNKNRQLRDSQVLASVRVGQEKLIEKTGYSKNIITKAVVELFDKQFIKCLDHRKKRGEFGTNE